MIHVTNDWILKPLPNADVQPLTNYVNSISCECFEPLVVLNSANQQYIESTTGLLVPVYQPAPDDVAYYTTIPSADWNRYVTAIDPTYVFSGKANTTYGLGYERYIDSNNWTQKLAIGYGRAPNFTAIHFNFFDPYTKTYKPLYLRCIVEYKKYCNGSTVDKRMYPQVYNYFWEEENNTDASKRTYIYESRHFNLDEDDDYPLYGWFTNTGTSKIYLSTDIGFDVINEKWVGLLNLHFIGINEIYATGDNTYSSSTRTANSFNGHRSAIGPFSSISQTSYADAVGVYSGLIPFYSRAFELEDFEPDIQNITLPMTKIGCYGPNTRISP